MLLKYWNAKFSKMFCLRSNFRTLEIFRVFPVFLCEKREKIWGESCSIRAALIPLLSLRTTTITIKNKTWSSLTPSRALTDTFQPSAPRGSNVSLASAVIRCAGTSPVRASIALGSTFWWETLTSTYAKTLDATSSCAARRVRYIFLTCLQSSFKLLNWWSSAYCSTVSMEWTLPHGNCTSIYFRHRHFVLWKPPIIH